MNTTRLLAALAALLLTAGTFNSVLAQNAPPPCKPTSEVPAFLGERYGEVLVSRGLLQDGSGTLSMYIGANGSWTAVIDRADGISCAVAAGQAWTAYSPEFPAQGTDG